MITPRSPLTHLLLAAAFAAAPAVAWQRGWSLAATAGAIRPTDDDRDIEASSLRVGASYAFRRGFALVAELEAGRFSGSRRLDSGESATVDTHALAASLLLRWHFVTTPRATAFLDTGYGLLSSGSDLPPGGSRLNGLRQVGLGLGARAGRKLWLVACLRQIHVSNGGGLAPDNPSYDGRGAYFGTLWRWGEPRPTPRPTSPPARREHGTRRLAGHLETMGGDFDGDRLTGAAMVLEAELRASWHFQAELAAARIAGESLDGVALHLSRRRPSWRLGLWLARDELAVFSTDEAALQAERPANDLVTVVATIGYQERNLDNDRAFGSLRFRIYPRRWLSIEAGIGALAGNGAGLAADDVRPTLAIEVQARPLERLGLSLVAERRLDDALVVGLRRHFGARKSLRRRHLEDATLRFRP